MSFPKSNLVSRRLIAAILGFTLVFAYGLGAGISAEAANLRKYAVAVLDANAGQILHSRGADATRYPASLTKVMTLYVLFEELEAGNLTLSTKMKVSRHAANAVPTKLGLKAGSTISVENAIKSLVTLSANDIARVIAEHISGTESAFAVRMTSTAQALGMSRTTYRNASGLPDSRQTTTVRDQARLGAAVFQHFPQYYDYFNLRSFTYGGRTYGNHNRLLGQVTGVDGIKTGYINASGFNLLTAARHDGHHLVVAAFGFNSSASRNKKVTELVNTYLKKTRSGGVVRTALIPRPNGVMPTVNGVTRIAALEGLPPPPPAHLRQRSFAAPATPLPTDAIVVASIAPPVPPATSDALLEAQQMAGSPVALEPIRLPAGDYPAAATARAATLTDFISGLLGFRESQPAEGFTPPAPVGDDITGSIPAQSQLPTGTWTVQVGAAPSQTGAGEMIDLAKSRNSELAGYRPYIQHISRDGQEFFRARFVGFSDRERASAMCEALKKKEISCLAMPV